MESIKMVPVNLVGNLETQWGTVRVGRIEKVALTDMHDHVWTSQVV